MNILERFHACVKIDIRGEPHSPIYVKMLPPLTHPERKSRRDWVTKLSRERYAPRTREAVEAHLKSTVFDWHAPAKSRNSRRDMPRSPAKKEYARPWGAPRSRRTAPEAAA